ncbi:MAG: methyltransferase domain-containing protein [Pseudobdellovibrionaceae bacterium]
MNDFCFRLASPSDIQFIEKLLNPSPKFGEQIGLPDRMSYLELAEHLSEQNQKSKFQIYLYVEASQPLGLYWIRSYPNSLLVNFAVAIEAKSRGKGISKHALKDLVDRVFVNFPETERLETHVGHENIRSIRTLLGANFEICGYAPNSFLRSNTLQHRIDFSLNFNRFKAEKEFTSNHAIPNNSTGLSETFRLDHQVEKLWSIESQLLDRLNLEETKSSSQLLDIGCGTGVHTKNIQDKFNIKFALGIDSSALAIESANLKFLKDKRISFCQSDALIKCQNLKESSFDIIVSRLFIQHMQDNYVMNLLEEVKRLLKPNGKFLVMGSDARYFTYTPKIQSAESLYRLKQLRRDYLKINHCKPEILTSSLAKIGLKNVQYISGFINNANLHPNFFAFLNSQSAHFGIDPSWVPLAIQVREDIVAWAKLQNCYAQGLLFVVSGEKI